MSYSRALLLVPVLFFVALSAAFAVLVPKPAGATVCAAVGNCADAGEPRPVLAPHAPRVISLWGGARSSIALMDDGSVWTWGLSNCVLGPAPCGKLGDGTTTERHVPVQVHGPGDVGYLDSVKAIMGGEHHNYALKQDGTVWAWGGNFAGQLGDGTYTNTVNAVQVSGLTNVKSLGGRGYHSLALKNDGTVWTWGWNSVGQLGYDTTGSDCVYLKGSTCGNVPGQVIGLTNVLTVTGGGFFSIALMSDHTLEAWGANEHGQLGNGGYTAQPSPVQVSSVLSNVIQVSGGWKHAVALTSDGKVWTWGDNTEGAIGNGVTSTIGISIPVQVPGLDHVIGVSGGDRYTAALKDDGTVWTWGSNAFGQLGNGTFTGSPSPVQVHNLSHVTYMAARDYHTLVIKDDGTVWDWGSGSYGELGNDNPVDSALPVQVLFPSGSATATPTATPTTTSNPSATATPTATATTTSNPSATATATFEGTVTATPTPTGTNDLTTDLRITKNGKSITTALDRYVLKVTDQSIYPAQGVQVKDKLPNGYGIIKVKSKQAVCQIRERKVVCDRAQLSSGVVLKIVIFAIPNGATGKNCAHVTTITPDVNLANNRACALVP